MSLSCEKAKPAVGGGGRLVGNDGAGKHPSCYENTTERAGSQALRLADGRVVAGIRGDCLVKKVRGSVHQLRTPRAWCCDTAILREAERLGARWVEIHDLEDGTVYRAPLSRFWTRGFRVSRGFGEQMALLLSDWSRDGAPCRADWVQLGLFV